MCSKVSFYHKHIINTCTIFAEPPPTFVWTHPVHGDLTTNEDYLVLHEEYQGGSTTTLVVNHAKVTLISIIYKFIIPSENK